jgi:hypothetical protein
MAESAEVIYFNATAAPTRATIPQHARAKNPKSQGTLCDTLIAETIILRTIDVLASRAFAAEGRTRQNPKTAE